MLKDLFGAVGDLVGTVAGVAIAPIAYAFGVSEHLVRRVPAARAPNREGNPRMD